MRSDPGNKTQCLQRWYCPDFHSSPPTNHPHYRLRHLQGQGCSHPHHPKYLLPHTKREIEVKITQHAWKKIGWCGWQSWFLQCRVKRSESTSGFESLPNPTRPVSEQKTYQFLSPKPYQSLNSKSHQSLGMAWNPTNHHGNFHPENLLPLETLHKPVSCAIPFSPKVLLTQGEAVLSCVSPSKLVWSLCDVTLRYSLTPDC